MLPGSLALVSAAVLVARVEGSCRTGSPRAPTSRIVASATSSATRFTNLLPATTPAPRLTAVQRARTIGSGALSGVLSTLQVGSALPFAAPVDYVLNERGDPVFMLKAGSVPQINAAASPLSSLLVVDASSGQALTLLGEVGPLPEQEFAQSHVDFLNVHPVARECIAPDGLSFFKLEVKQCYLHAPPAAFAPSNSKSADAEGTWLAVSDYASATIDALAPYARHIIDSVNGPRRSELHRFCEAYYSQAVNSAQLISLDELGFDLEVTVGGGAATERRRVGFSEPRKTEQEARSLFVKTFFQAWEPPEPKGDKAE